MRTILLIGFCFLSKLRECSEPPKFRVFELRIGPKLKKQEGFSPRGNPDLAIMKFE